jgi:hypothetical protein
MDTIGIVSILEDQPYKDVKALWRLFEKEFDSVGVQVFPHPHVAFQVAKTEAPAQLKKDLHALVSEIRPFEIEVSGVGHFDKKVIYLKVKKTKRLIAVGKLINQFLKMHCRGLLDYYTPEN